MRDHSNRRIDTLVQAALLGLTLELTCPGCGQRRLLAAAPIWYLFHRRGWSGRRGDISGRFFCAPCGAQKGRIRTRPHVAFTDDPAPPASGAWPYPTDRVWKRLVARYRS